MNLLQAINQAGENWFRPVKQSWIGQAIAIENDVTILAPDDIGENCNFMISDVDALTGEWEIVTPEQVLIERK